MKRFELKPSKERFTDSLLKGYGYIPDLPIARYEYLDGSQVVVSCWRVPFFKRLKFLFDGRINVAVMGKGHPPISVVVGEYEK